MKITAKHVEILIAFASLVVAIATCQVSKTQALIVESQLQSHKKENQPSFFVEKYTAHHDSTECFRISITKNSVNSIQRVHTETYYKIDEVISNPSRYEILKTYYLPVLEYYKSHDRIYGLTNVIVCDTTPGNLRSYLDFKTECRLRIAVDKSRSYSCDKIDFIVVDYDDIYDNSHRVFYEGESASTKERYEEVVRLSREEFGNNYYYLGLFSLEDVLKDLDGK